MIELRHGYVMTREFSASRRTAESHLCIWFHTSVQLSPRLNVITELTSRVLSAGIDKLVS